MVHILRAIDDSPCLALPPGGFSQRFVSDVGRPLCLLLVVLFVFLVPVAKMEEQLAAKYELFKAVSRKANEFERIDDEKERVYNWVFSPSFLEAFEGKGFLVRIFFCLFVLCFDGRQRDWSVNVSKFLGPVSTFFFLRENCLE